MARITFSGVSGMHSSIGRTGRPRSRRGVFFAGTRLVACPYDMRQLHRSLGTRSGRSPAASSSQAEIPLLEPLQLRLGIAEAVGQAQRQVTCKQPRPRSLVRPAIANQGGAARSSRRPNGCLPISSARESTGWRSRRSARLFGLGWRRAG